MIGNQSGAHSLKQIDKKKEKETEDLEDHVWDSLFDDVAGPDLVIQNMQMKTTRICPHLADGHSWKSPLSRFTLLGTNSQGDSVLGLRLSSAWTEQVKSTSSGPHDTHKTSPHIVQEI